MLQLAGGSGSTAGLNLQRWRHSSLYLRRGPWFCGSEALEKREIMPFFEFLLILGLSFEKLLFSFQLFGISQLLGLMPRRF
jgi:hypothetical protein